MHPFGIFIPALNRLVSSVANLDLNLKVIAIFLVCCIHRQNLSFEKTNKPILMFNNAMSPTLVILGPGDKLIKAHISLL